MKRVRASVRDSERPRLRTRREMRCGGCREWVRLVSYHHRRKRDGGHISPSATQSFSARTRAAYASASSGARGSIACARRGKDVRVLPRRRAGDRQKPPSKGQSIHNFNVSDGEGRKMNTQTSSITCTPTGAPQYCTLQWTRAGSQHCAVRS